MSSWDAMSFEGKETVLRVVRQEADQFFGLADSDAAWHAPTGAGGWEVRDIAGHLVDTTEAYFASFDAARGQGEVPAAYGLPGMAARVDKQARAFRDQPREAMMGRLRRDFAKMMEIFDGLTEQEWTGLLVPHFYMGPLPSFFYPAFHLMDYAVHSWDVHEGTGRAHGLSGEAADLLAPFMFVLWKYTISAPPAESFELGVRVTSGASAGDTLVRLGPDGMDYTPAAGGEAATVLEFDPGSLVLTAFGRSNSGTIRGERSVADTYLNLFFRI